MEHAEALFVYNADGNVASLMMDAAHKAISPATYHCQLCSLTYGFVRQRPKWAAFVASLGLPVRFLHKDEFRQDLPPHAEDALPALYLDNRPGELRVLIPADELNALESLDQLQALALKRLNVASP